jgi:hypothetical protein
MIAYISNQVVALCREVSAYARPCGHKQVLYFQILWLSQLVLLWSKCRVFLSQSVYYPLHTLQSDNQSAKHNNYLIEWWKKIRTVDRSVAILHTVIHLTIVNYSNCNSTPSHSLKPHPLYVVVITASLGAELSSIELHDVRDSRVSVRKHSSGFHCWWAKTHYT